MTCPKENVHGSSVVIGVNWKTDGNTTTHAAMPCPKLFSFGVHVVKTSDSFEDKALIVYQAWALETHGALRLLCN